MAISEQQRQKKLAKKKQKRASVTQKIANATQQIAWLTNTAKNCNHYPIHECLIPVDLFSLGLGEVVIARRMLDSNIAVSAFVVDVGCLGVKNALFNVISEHDYETKFKAALTLDGERVFEKIHPSCAKSILDGAVAYAKDLGFSPHSDYQKAYSLFGTIDASVCPEKYVYGNAGKPYYINGPYETPADIERIVKTLTKKCGEDGFTFIYKLEGF